MSVKFVMDLLGYTVELLYFDFIDNSNKIVWVAESEIKITCNFLLHSYELRKDDFAWQI